MTGLRNNGWPLWVTLLLATPLLAGPGPAPIGGVATPPPQLAQIEPRAVRQILTSAVSSDPQVRTNAMEACEFLELPLATPQLELGLEDDVVPVRFSALVTIGSVEIRSLVPLVNRVLKQDGVDPHVWAAAFFALHRCGQRVDLTLLARMLRSNDAGMRGNAAMLLGMMGDRSAVPMLKELGRAPLPATTSHVRGVIARIQVAEARARLGDESAMSMIRSGLFSSHMEVRILAAGMLGGIGDYKMEEAFFGILRHDKEATIELKLSVLDALARMERNLTVVNEALESMYLALEAAEMQSPVVRAQAARTLGSMEAARRRGRARLDITKRLPPPQVVAQFRQDDGAVALLKLLDDPIEAVRVAAATAWLQLIRRAGSATED